MYGKKPSIRDQREHFIIHLVTSGLNSGHSQYSISKSIVNLAASLKTESNCFSVSTIILRTDNPHLNEKLREFMAYLKTPCKGKNIH